MLPITPIISFQVCAHINISEGKKHLRVDCFSQKKTDKKPFYGGYYSDYSAVIDINIRGNPSTASKNQ